MIFPFVSLRGRNLKFSSNERNVLSSSIVHDMIWYGMVCIASHRIAAKRKREKMRERDKGKKI